MKTFLFAFLILLYSVTFAQPAIEFSSQKTNNGLSILASNPEYCAVSVKIKFNLKNLFSTKGNEFVIVIPAKTNHYAFVDLNKENDSNGFSYSYDVTSTFGDATIEQYDTNYYYSLPFEKGNEYQVQQGYFGKYTHQEVRALDIEMPLGTKVCAARKGIIITQIDDNKKHCADPSCVNFNNYIDILHDDGTIANYSHLKYQSSRFKLGDVVDEGNVIAESDQTGYTSGPHLHFVVYLPAFENKKTLPTLFKINNGDEFALLKEKQFYFKNY